MKRFCLPHFEMLILTRKVGQAIVIDGRITVRVVATGNVVKLGVEAPLFIRVDREEVHLQRLREAHESAAKDPKL